jgi:Helix-turn-helix domain of transposase family ISL3
VLTLPVAARKRSLTCPASRSSRPAITAASLNYLSRPQLNQSIVVSARHRPWAYDRRGHVLHDVPVGGRATVLVWWKRIWRCPNPDCGTRTWTEQVPLAAPRCAMTQRAKVWLARRVGSDAHTMAALARELGLGWDTVRRAVTDVGTPLIDDHARLE